MTDIEYPIVQADNISHYYRQGLDSQPVLQGISLTVKSGEIVAIVGASGCGKSTLVRLLAGLDRPTAGEILIAGDPPQQALAKYAIGLAFQKPILFPWWTVLDNILLPIKLRQRRISREDKQQAIAYLTQLGIGNAGHLYPRQLSGGMLQRAAIARALMGEPKVLMLDEPFSAVDEITREQLWVDFHQVWRQQHLSVILVTHSIHEAVFMSNRVLVMSRHQGKIEAEFLIPLGRDRSDDLLDSGEYLKLVKNIRGSL
jgi:NitT/TauT family transport system ATP-binding protein